MRVLIPLVALVASASACTPATATGTQTVCVTFDPYAGETGYYNFDGTGVASPEITVKIGDVITFDQTDASNWYHPIGFAYEPDGAHGSTWGGDELPEVEGLGELLYKIDGAATTCADAGDTGLDCYEPEFFYPRADWTAKSYTAELTITADVAASSYGGVIYYFCHIHSKMSGKIVIQNADGSAYTGGRRSGCYNPTTHAVTDVAEGSCTGMYTTSLIDASASGGNDYSTFPVSAEKTLYSTTTHAAFDTTCGTTGMSSYAPDGASACSESFLAGTIDTDFEKCMQAADCMMNRNMRVLGYDTHADPVATFAQQMIPHHLNAINMAKTIMKLDSTGVGDVEDLEDHLWGIINMQSFQVHQFRNYLGGSDEYQAAVDHTSTSLTATAVGPHCDATATGSFAVSGTSYSESDGASVSGCTPSATNICVSLDIFGGESGYYKFAGHEGRSPTITAKIGDTITFDQSDPSNWYHPIGFAYEPDGAHGSTWGGDELPEVEGAGELLYKIDGAATTCADAGDTGLDCYEPEFFYPRGDWTAKKYTAELTITADVAAASNHGVIYYFCHIHSKMSGKIVIENADGSHYHNDNAEVTLYAPSTIDPIDNTCGTSKLAPYAGGDSTCSEQFLCGTLDTTFEKCLQAVDCAMNVEMKAETTADSANKVAVFMQQMIPHHQNAVNMAKTLMKLHSTEVAAVEDLEDILWNIVNVQNFQVHQFRNYLAGENLLLEADIADEFASPSSSSSSDGLSTGALIGIIIGALVVVGGAVLFVKSKGKKKGAVKQGSAV